MKKLSRYAKKIIEAASDMRKAGAKAEMADVVASCDLVINEMQRYVDGNSDDESDKICFDCKLGHVTAITENNNEHLRYSGEKLYVDDGKIEFYNNFVEIPDLGIVVKFGMLYVPGENYFEDDDGEYLDEDEIYDSDGEVYVICPLENPDVRNHLHYETVFNTFPGMIRTFLENTPVAERPKVDLDKLEDLECELIYSAV